jgi:hypothetical protein
VATGDYEGEDDAEEMVEIRGYSRRRTRYSLGLGGGVTIVNRTASPVLELSGRVERLGQLRIGGEASLWLVDGLHGQGHFLATLGKAFGWRHRFELGGGTGLTITGDAAGPAVNLTLRARVHRQVGTYLRYDGALLIHSGSYDGQNAGSFGIEASF